MSNKMGYHDFVSHFIGWLFERYYKKKTEGENALQ
jgi:hypothetical protein